VLVDVYKVCYMRLDYIPGTATTFSKQRVLMEFWLA